MFNQNFEKASLIFSTDTERLCGVFNCNLTKDCYYCCEDNKKKHIDLALLNVEPQECMLKSCLE